MAQDASGLFDVRDKVVVITGAGGGIGGVLTRSFLALGAQVVAAEIREDADIAEGAVYHQTDIADQDSVASLATFIADSFGAADVLINNAAIEECVRIEDMSVETWNSTISVNLTGSFLCAQALGRQMIARRRGKIINVASRCAYVGIPFAAAYDASKAGVVSLTKTFAIEWGNHNLQVNAIVPGYVDTPMGEGDQMRDAYVRKVPLGRASKPEDLLGAVVFLSSAASDYVTGAILFVDGGSYASGGLGAELRDAGPARIGSAQQRGL